MDAAAKAIENHFNYTFSNPDLLRLALTHRSFAIEHNERLEFLGDAVLDLIISDILFYRYDDVDEGDLSRMRSWLVKKESLYKIGEQYQLSQYIKMGEGEARSGGMQRKSTIADTVEALIAAVYLDGGFKQAKSFVELMFAKQLNDLPDKDSLKDAKSQLQEYLQSRQLSLPIYELVNETGKPHEKVFKVSCQIEKLHIKEFAEGISRRKAEQLAAKKVLERIEE